LLPSPDRNPTSQSNNQAPILVDKPAISENASFQDAAKTKLSSFEGGAGGCPAAPAL